MTQFSDEFIKEQLEELEEGYERNTYEPELILDYEVQAVENYYPALKEIQRLREALSECELSMNHALELGYCGEGSTRGMIEDALKKARKALGGEG